MEDEARNFIKSWLKVIASLSYSYFISSKLPKGIFRFFSLLPIFYLFTFLPLSVSRPIPSVILAGFFTWIANFKLLLYSFNLGPLSTNYPQSSFLKFLFLAAFPITIRDKARKGGGSDTRNLTTSSKVVVFDVVTEGKESSDVRNLTNNSRNANIENDCNTTTKVIPLNFWSKSLIFILLDVVYHNIKNMVLLCCLMYLFIDIMFGICDVIVKATLGVELEPPSDEPYLATSLQDFWGKRWNRMISGTLRHTVYKPTRSMAANLVGQKWAPLPAVMCCFIVSGLMHELIYYHMTRASPTWEVSWFFVLHGLCVILEMLVKRALGPNWRLHWAVSGPLTVGFVMVTGFWLFFPQIMRNNVDKKATEDILGLVNYFKEAMNIISV